jgi:hypothetical protein
MVTAEQQERYKELLKQRKSIYKKVNRKTKITFFIFMTFGAILGFVIMGFAFRADQNGTMDIDIFMRYFLFGVLFLLVMYPLQIIIHEAGHLIFGLFTGYKFLSFRIFLHIFYKKEGRIFRRKFSIKGTAGQCLMYPPQRR